MMCTICGCGTATSEQRDAVAHLDGHGHGAHDHGAHRHGVDGVLNFGTGGGGVHLPGISTERIIHIERDILAKNDAYARANRTRLMTSAQFALNFVSSPGSGKTTLLVRAIYDLRSHFPIAVIEGDQQTANDAERIRATGAPAIQINTGKGCHLDAHMVGHALDQLSLRRGGLLFIENVGNLVCPASFDLGEAHKVLVLSVTEGEDKPLKYPDMFAGADLLVLNKIDLLPYLDFDVAACIGHIRRVNPGIDIVSLSALTGEGMHALYRWIEDRAAKILNDTPSAAANAIVDVHSLSAQTQR
jgi:hydrogenase nickel incorporation protein HypB